MLAGLSTSPTPRTHTRQYQGAALHGCLCPCLLVVHLVVGGAGSTPHLAVGDILSHNTLVLGGAAGLLACR